MMPARSPLETLLDYPILKTFLPYLNYRELVNFNSVSRSARKNTQIFLKRRLLQVSIPETPVHAVLRYDMIIEKAVEGGMVFRVFTVVGGPALHGRMFFDKGWKDVQFQGVTHRFPSSRYEGKYDPIHLGDQFVLNGKFGFLLSIRTASHTEWDPAVPAIPEHTL